MLRESALKLRVLENMEAYLLAQGAGHEKHSQVVEQFPDQGQFRGAYSFFCVLHLLLYQLVPVDSLQNLLPEMVKARLFQGAYG